MKKTCLLMVILAMLFSTAIPAFAAEMPSGTGDDVADLTASLDTYFSDYLPGLKAESRNAIKSNVRTGLQNNKDKYFMPMMSTLANIRKAGQAGESEGVKDVINEYYKLSDKAKNNAVNNLSSALKGIFLTVNFSNGVLSVSDGGSKLTDIVFVTKDPAAVQATTQAPQATQPPATTKKPDSAATTAVAQTTKPSAANNDASAPNQGMVDAANSDAPAPDVTKLYFNAYLPGISQETIDDTKALIKVYSENGGGPAGSGALWRCIREIGTLMGREVDMAADYSGYTVIEEGETEFLKLSADVQEQVIEKVKEGMSGIAVTAAYENGTFTFTKLGETQFTYTVQGAQTEETTEETTESAAENEGEGSFKVLYIILAIVVVVGVVLLVIFKDKIFNTKTR